MHLYHLLHSEHQHHCPWLPKYDAPKYSLSPDVELFYELKKIIMAYRTFYKKLLVLRAELELAIFALMDRPGMVEVEANNTDEDRELTSSLLRALLGGTVCQDRGFRTGDWDYRAMDTEGGDSSSGAGETPPKRKRLSVRHSSLLANAL